MTGTQPRRTPLVAGNWKMHLTEVWSRELAVALVDGLRGRDDHATEVAVAPSFPCLRAVADVIAGTPVLLAAQNVHWEERGPYTGEVSARMLQEIQVRYVIVGHSERRQWFGESDERVGRKVRAVQAHGMTPILCVGEQSQHRDEGRTLQVVERQLRRGLAEASLRTGADLVVAYEPVWAIGTGRHATPEQADEVHRMIREQLASLYGAEISSAVRILYGGSVTPENAGALMALDEVDGALVGGASLEAESFLRIIEAARQGGPVEPAGGGML